MYSDFIHSCSPLVPFKTSEYIYFTTIESGISHVTIQMLVSLNSCLAQLISPLSSSAIPIVLLLSSVSFLALPMTTMCIINQAKSTKAESNNLKPKLHKLHKTTINKSFVLKKLMLTFVSRSPLWENREIYICLIKYEMVVAHSIALKLNYSVPITIEITISLLKRWTHIYLFYCFKKNHSKKAKKSRRFKQVLLWIMKSSALN